MSKSLCLTVSTVADDKFLVSGNNLFEKKIFDTLIKLKMTQLFHFQHIS